MSVNFFAQNEHDVGPQTMWGLIGVVPLATGVAVSCPLYSMNGFSTCPREGNC